MDSVAMYYGLCRCHYVTSIYVDMDMDMDKGIDGGYKWIGLTGEGDR